ncbi:FLYWCH-type zinc finger-containing protein 1-like [Aedes albopictus]|uniref:FLYWCH-type domain-containing protein n=1 Tax=Aedes albopictus TaxID=7160 RepID=A0ABM1XNQ8_AEDAL
MIFKDDECVGSSDRVYTFLTSRKGGIHLVHDRYIYRSNLRRCGRNKDIIYWECVHNRAEKCRGRLKSVGDQLYISNWNNFKIECTAVQFVRSRKGKPLLLYKGHQYTLNRRRKQLGYWECVHRRSKLKSCPSRITTDNVQIKRVKGEHDHMPPEMIEYLLDDFLIERLVEPELIKEEPNKLLFVRSRWGRKLLIYERYVFFSNKRVEATNTTYWRCAYSQELKFIKSPWSTPCLVINDFLYNCHSTRGNKVYWRCHNYSRKKKEERCRARCVIVNGRLSALTGTQHNHDPHTEKIAKISRRNNMVDEVLDAARADPPPSYLTSGLYSSSFLSGGSTLLDSGSPDIVLDFTPDDAAECRTFIRSQRGAPLLALDNFIYRCERVRKTRSYWLCIRYKSSKCNGRVICQGNKILKVTHHCHVNDEQRINSSILEETDLSSINLEAWYKQTMMHKKHESKRK